VSRDFKTWQNVSCEESTVRPVTGLTSVDFILKEAEFMHKTKKIYRSFIFSDVKSDMVYWHLLNTLLHGGGVTLKSLAQFETVPGNPACVVACPEGTYKNFTAPGDKSTCLACPDPHQTSEVGSTSDDQCRCGRGYRPDGHHTCTGDQSPSSFHSSSVLAASRRHISSRRKRSLRRQCN